MKIRISVLAIFCLLFVHPVLAFDLQGHRGARGLAPENTLPAFATALSLGVTTLELDVGITKDGEVVISHNPSLNPDITRDKDGKWLPKTGPAIHSLTFAELQQYDVGRLKPNTDYAKLLSEQSAVDGTRIPKLADLFELVKKSGNEQVRFNIETKTSPLNPNETLDPENFAKTLVELTQKEGMATRVTIQSFDWRTLLVVQKMAQNFRRSISLCSSAHSTTSPPTSRKAHPGRQVFNTRTTARFLGWSRRRGAGSGLLFPLTSPKPV